MAENKEGWIKDIVVEELEPHYETVKEKTANALTKIKEGVWSTRNPVLSGSSNNYTEEERRRNAEAARHIIVPWATKEFPGPEGLKFDWLHYGTPGKAEYAEGHPTLMAQMRDLTGEDSFGIAKAVKEGESTAARLQLEGAERAKYNIIDSVISAHKMTTGKRPEVSI